MEEAAMGGWGAAALLLCLASGLATGQRSNALIQSLVSRLKNSPQHYSISPSYSSQRRQEVLAVHSLPLQTESGVAPSITDVITGNLGKFETSETNEVKAGPEAGPEASDSQSLGSQQRPVKKPRRRRPGKVGARPVRRSRPGGPRPPLGRKERPRPSRRIKERNRFEQQVAVEEFFPQEEEENFYLRPERPVRPGRRGPMRPEYSLGPKRNPRKGPRPSKKDIRHNKKDLRPHNKDPGPPKKDLRPKRQKPRPPTSPSLRPGPPRRKRKPQGLPAPRPGRGYPRKPTSFRPPKTVYKGFAPTLQSSAPYDDSPLYLDDPVSKPKRPKRRRRPKPVAPEQQVEVAEIPDLRPFTDEAPSVRPRRPASYSAAPTDFNPFDKPKSVINFSTKSPMSINMPGPPYEADSQRLSPFSDEEPRFPSDSSRPDRPKRQKAAQQYRPLQQGPEAEAQYNEVATGGAQDNIGFFNNVQENFPDIESFGIGWESSKIRRKRSAQRSILRHVPPSKSRRARRGPRPAARSPQRQTPSRRQGPAGFWDDAEFDAEFFNGGAPPSYNSFESFSQNRFQVNNQMV